MIYDWRRTIQCIDVRELHFSEGQNEPVTLTGEGLWAGLISSGRCRMPSQSAPGVEHALQAGMLVLGPGPLCLIPEGAAHILAVQLAGTAAAQFLAGLPHLPYAALGETCPAAAELLTRLAAENDQEGYLPGQIAFALLCELSGADSVTPALPLLVEEALRDIRSNYAGLYGVEELSEKLGVSKSHLVRSFTAAMGISPGRYLTKVRIDAVKNLLLHREYSLEVIASLTGFSGANYLCRVFKKETGQSPAQWRAAVGRAAAPGTAESARELELYM